MSDPNNTQPPEVTDTRISDEDIQRITKAIEEKIPAKPKVDKGPTPSDSKRIKELEVEIQKLHDEKRTNLFTSLEFDEEQTKKYKEASIEVLEAVLDFKETKGKPKGVSKAKPDDKKTATPETAAQRLAAEGKTGNWNHLTGKWE